MNGPAASNDSPSWKEPSLERRRLLFLLLTLTVVRGLIYLTVMPPWQHYDEPTHFEYVRLIAERGRLPKPQDYDLDMRREIAASMKAASFWGKSGSPMIDFRSTQPPRIGTEELHHPPLYYALLALPQTLLTEQEVEIQLYAARLVSVLLYVLIVAAAYGMLTDLFPRRRWLPLAVAALIALLPPLTDLMSAVNNDVGAVAAVTLLLWAAVRLIKHGPSPKRVALLLLLAGFCFMTKSTAKVMAVAILLAVAGSLVPQARRRWLWIGLALLLLIAVPATFTWNQHAAYWYSDDEPAAANRVSTLGLLGPTAFGLSTEGNPYARTLFQELGRSEGYSLKGHTVTLGAWLKAADEPGETVILSLRDGQAKHVHEVEATTDWQFQAFTATITTDANGVAAYVTLPKSTDKERMVFIDGLVLADGEMPLTAQPQFETNSADEGQWGKQQFRNLLRNSSAEKTWPGMRSWLGNATAYLQPISMAFHSLLDVSRTSWVYGPSLSNLFQSFWGRFGWNHIALPPACFYPLGILTILAILGYGIGTVRLLRADSNSEPWQRRAWVVLGVALLVGWGSAILRIHPRFFIRNPVWTMARYASVAIVPTATLLCSGLAEIVPRRWIRWAAFAGLLGMVTLDVVALATVILPFYYG